LITFLFIINGGGNITVIDYGNTLKVLVLSRLKDEKIAGAD